MRTGMIQRALTILLFTLLFALPASAAPCGGDFNTFIAAIARATIDQAFAGITPNAAVLAFDRRQRGMFHAKSFEEYASTRVIPPRIKRAQNLMAKHAALLSRIEQKFGVPP